MKRTVKGFLFKSVNRTRVVPVRLKIIIIFILFIVLSNLSTNFINMMYNRNHQMKLMKIILAKDLKDLHVYSNTRYEIFTFNNDKDGALHNIKNKALYEMKNRKAAFIAVTPEGEILLDASHEGPVWESFAPEALQKMKESMEDEGQGFLSVKNGDYDYFGIYKYNSKWDAFLFRAEEYGEFYEESWATIEVISIIILISTVVLTILGVFVIGYILRFIGVITNAIMDMVKNQQLELIPLKNAPNDDITYMGMAFNSLSSTIETLLQIFKRFTNKDIAYKAYTEKVVRLEGAQKDLTILFSDIKGFTTITETLGTDIIKLINMHYDRAIREIIRYDGTIGSIIGDAILAMFGTMDEVATQNKSLSAIVAAYELQAIAESLRLEMTKKKEAIVRVKGGLSREEEQVYNALMIEIGVGLDGGDVFYGNIGSYVRMTNTVIGDNVNAASRLEGLTRIYKVPVICSEYVKKDVQVNSPDSGVTFIEIDTVQVKGKTVGKKIYWPILDQYMTGALKKDLNRFTRALKLYYTGKWASAHREFKQINLPIAQEFINRTAAKTVPKNWKGIWAMKSK
ncbi:MAG: adenylate/guanylate cyclase domain-containing protein [Spirochaetes bacterium]|jgi:adenylate cyclase|nr:adenylate/guanylate cyclase domain-containing protein [Spirochaetota bacterium]